ncbi:VF530 family DNA-binding protein [Thalassolituus sp. LLYu03]|uniref:VF530 family protein n=1 Tax=Thalassolituus sp. LLYu03 TaxID=3421656 RepID=UPI003D298F4D
MTENSRKTDHLQGVTLENLLNQLVDEFGWEGLAGFIRINCFRSNPSIKSSLTFLRRTPWARAQVEVVFIGFKEGEGKSQITQRLKALDGAPAAKNTAAKDNRPASGRADAGRSAPRAPRQQQSKPAPDPWGKARAKDQQ